MRKTKPVMKYRRKRQAKTNYKKRLDLLKSSLPRIVIRISLNDVIIQGVEYAPDGDKILFSAHSKQLQKLGWKAHRSNLPTAYLTGYLCGKKAKDTKGEFILDLNKSNLSKGNKIYAALKGLLDAGLNVLHSEDIVPQPERLSGKHIEDYAKKIKDSDAYKKQFSAYLKQGFAPEEFTKHFEEIKQKIEKV
ncbi:50S ribosomal protein L18 [Candidatus Woesearchaeota archaeon]|nr:50S ribosomal protein L18 [Candidatus Woesearchaeota archaeon]MBW3013740.1 50S ribosomal protein L18 [Candidatus Woesearchaeota archaeon]